MPSEAAEFPENSYTGRKKRRCHGFSGDLCVYVRFKY